MKFPIHFRMARRALCLACTLCLLASLTACGRPLHKMTASNGEYFDKWTDITYVALPASYEPIVRGEEYGKVNISGIDNILYEIEGLSSTEYLTSAYGAVYHDKELFVPTFTDWDISSLKVCTDRAIIVSHLTLTPEDPSHLALMEDIQATWTNAPAVDYPSYLTPKEQYTLRFSSDDAPGLYYAIKILAYDQDVYTTVSNEQGEEIEVSLGRTFLYDRYSKRCVAIDDSIFRLMEGEELTPDTPSENPS
jgi:hypothetical protein